MIATLRMGHRLVVLYESGNVREDMESNARTAFYSIGWAIQEVWRRIVCDFRDSKFLDANLLGYCGLLSGAKLLLPVEVWTLFFTRYDSLNSFVIPPVLGLLPSLPETPAIYVSITQCHRQPCESPRPSRIGNTDVTLGERVSRTAGVAGSLN